MPLLLFLYWFDACNSVSTTCVRGGKGWIHEPTSASSGVEHLAHPLMQVVLTSGSARLVVCRALALHSVVSFVVVRKCQFIKPLGRVLLIS
jgi:hypothetical protein